MYSRGCIFVDLCSGYIHVEFQAQLSSHQTLEAKENFEKVARNMGIIPQSYATDNSTAFTAAKFAEHLLEFKQVNQFAGVGAHHHNGSAERAIGVIMSIARTMMMHSAIHWPDMADPSLWPMAVTHAVFIYNHMPRIESGLSPLDVFRCTRWPQSKFHDCHVWGCPIYVLDHSIADGKKIPKWNPRSQRHMYMGVSPHHASSVPLVLNPKTGVITAQYNVVFDDWFATIPATDDTVPDFNDEEWECMFSDSRFQYVPQDGDEPIPFLQRDFQADQVRA